jgi:hypothetical protein
MVSVNSNSLLKSFDFVAVCYLVLVFVCVRCTVGHLVAQLSHCATSRKVAGSISDGVITFFH